MAKNQNNDKTLGYAQFGAYMHRDNGGKVRVAAYTSVNKPLSIEAHDETTQIAKRTYRIVEDERPILDGNKFYTKDVWNEQNSSDEERKTRTEKHDDVDEPAEMHEKDGLTPLKVLKNFVDNIAADVRNLQAQNVVMWTVILCVGLLAAVALAFSI